MPAAKKKAVTKKAPKKLTYWFHAELFRGDRRVTSFSGVVAVEKNIVDSETYHIFRDEVWLKGVTLDNTANRMAITNFHFLG